MEFRLKNLFVLFLAAACVCGCSKKQEVAEDAVKVKTFTVGGGQDASLYYSGSLEAQENISLSFLTVGTAEQINVREGDKVQKGQLLAKLDCVSNQSTLQMAAAKARQARDAYNRFEPMYKNGNLPEIKMVEIKTDLSQAESALKLAQKSVNDCSIIAPVSGMISMRDLENGDNVIPGKAVLKLVSLGNLYATIAVPEKEIHRIYKGQKAKIELSAGNSETFEGTVNDVGVSADPLSRTYTVRIKVANASAELLPGMLCNVYLTPKKGDVKSDGFIIPASALKMDGDNKEFVFVLNEGSNSVSKQLVETDGFRLGGVMVTGGLQKGQQIVVEGTQKLDEGSPVEAEK